MRRLLPIPLLALLATAAVPTTAHAGWAPARAATHAGNAFGPTATAGPGDRVALGWVRELGGSRGHRGQLRAEVRTGRARSGLRGRAEVLDSSRSSVEAPVGTYAGGGAFAFAWRRYENGNHRLRFAAVDRNGRAGAAQRVTSGGESAYQPVWLGAPHVAPVLTWSRRTTVAAAPLDGSSLGAPFALPASPLNLGGGVPGPGGALTVAWADRGALRVADRPSADAPFGVPTRLGAASSSYISDPHVLRVARSGATVVLWKDGAQLLAAVRPAGGAFGASVVLLDGGVGPFDAVANTTGEVHIYAVATGDETGRVRSRPGPLRLVRLRADGAVAGPVRTLAAAATAPAAAADGTGSTFVTWLGDGSHRAIYAARVAAGGITARPHRLAARSSAYQPAIAATAEGAAVAGWVHHGVVLAATYRP